MTRDSSGLTGPRRGGNTSRSSRGLGRRPKYTREPDPLKAVEYTGDLQQDAATEISALEQGYRDRAKEEAARFKRATDSEYWFAVCFDSREEKDRFLQRAGLADIGDKYLDGREVANRLSVDLD